MSVSMKMFHFLASPTWLYLQCFHATPLKRQKKHESKRSRIFLCILTCDFSTWQWKPFHWQTMGQWRPVDGCRCPGKNIQWLQPDLRSQRWVYRLGYWKSQGGHQKLRHIQGRQPSWSMRIPSWPWNKGCVRKVLQSKELDSYLVCLVVASKATGNGPNVLMILFWYSKNCRNACWIVVSFSMTLIVTFIAVFTNSILATQNFLHALHEENRILYTDYQQQKSFYM